MSLLTNYQFDQNEFLDLDIKIDKEFDSLFVSMVPRGRHVFSLNLLGEIRALFRSISEHSENVPKFLIFISGRKDVFNYGGDLALFSEAIKHSNRDALLEYGYACINVLYKNYTALSLPLTTISLIEGDALGGGFEAALSSRVLIAEKGVKMGFPEILFNLFPGMGAYELLSEKLNSACARKIILSEKLYLADELYEMGLVDVLAEKGQGRVALNDYIRKSKRKSNGRLGLDKVALEKSSFDFTSLEKSLQVWVDCAMNLTPQDLKMMGKLVNKQASKSRHYSTLCS